MSSGKCIRRAGNIFLQIYIVCFVLFPVTLCYVFCQSVLQFERLKLEVLVKDHDINRLDDSEICFYYCLWPYLTLKL